MVLTAGVVSVRAVAGHAGDYCLGVGQGRRETGSFVPVWRTEFLNYKYQQDDDSGIASSSQIEFSNKTAGS